MNWKFFKPRVVLCLVGFSLILQAVDAFVTAPTCSTLQTASTAHKTSHSSFKYQICAIAAEENREANKNNKQEFPQAFILPSKNTTQHRLYLYSLPASNLLEQSLSAATSNSSSSAHTALLIRRLWEWKDNVLGDGRDYFVPRPNTLSALNQLLREQLQATECVVLSNCARFDVLLVVVDDDFEQQQDERLRQRLVYTLLQQYLYDQHQKQASKNSFFSSTLSLLDGGDRPQRLWLDLTHPPTSACVSSRESKRDVKTSKNVGSIEDAPLVDPMDVKIVAKTLVTLEGPANIARYLCRVAAGLEAQGRRPGRPVVFRPFSSRDAHIMLQLKRTADIANPKQTQQSIGVFARQTQPRLKALLDVALQSGKAARDPDLVPAILPLKQYGSGGSSSRYSLGDAPIELSNQAAQQATELAIDPMVAKYVKKWTALEVSEQIQAFWQAMSVAVEEKFGVDLETSAKAKPMRAVLHPYLMAIREGTTVKMDDALRELENVKDLSNLSTG